MRNYIFLFCLVICILGSCKPKKEVMRSNTAVSPTAKTDSVSKDITAPKDTLSELSSKDTIKTEKEPLMEVVPAMALSCVAKKDVKEGERSYEVWITVEGVKSKVAESWVCKIFDKHIYEQYDIPDEALEACGGWDDAVGKADFFYLTKHHTLGYVVYRGDMYAEAEVEDYGYRVVGRIQKAEDGNYEFVEYKGAMYY